MKKLKQTKNLYLTVDEKDTAVHWQEIYNFIVYAKGEDEGQFIKDNYDFLAELTSFILIQHRKLLRELKKI